MLAFFMVEQESFYWCINELMLLAGITDHRGRTSASSKEWKAIA